MYVCLCNSITDREIRRAAKNGADNLYELQQSLGVATNCGTCAQMAEEILHDELGKQAGRSIYVPTLA